MASYPPPDEQGTPVPTTAQAALAVVLLVVGAILTIHQLVTAFGL